MENLIKRNPMTHQYRPPHQLYLRAVCSSKAKPPEKEKKTQAVSFALISWVFHFFSDRPIFHRYFLGGLLQQVFRAAGNGKWGKSGGLLGCHSNAANASLYVSNSGVGSHICSYSALLCLAFCETVRNPPLYIHPYLYMYRYIDI